MRAPRAESASYARQALAAVRTLDPVGPNSGDRPPHEMSYLIVTKLQYTVTQAQESGFTGCTMILCFPQQCPFWTPETASMWQCGHVDRSPRRTYNSFEGAARRGGTFHFRARQREKCHEHRSSPA